MRRRIFRALSRFILGPGAFLPSAFIGAGLQQYALRTRFSEDGSVPATPKSRVHLCQLTRCLPRAERARVVAKFPADSWAFSSSVRKDYSYSDARPRTFMHLFYTSISSKPACVYCTYVRLDEPVTDVEALECTWRIFSPSRRRSFSLCI